jgi:hypothetical protein
MSAAHGFVGLSERSTEICVVRPDEDAFFLQVRVLSGQALEHPVADPRPNERSDEPERGVESLLQAEGKQAGRNEVNAVATS